VDGNGIARRVPNELFGGGGIDCYSLPLGGASGSPLRCLNDWDTA